MDITIQKKNYSNKNMRLIQGGLAREMVKKVIANDSHL
jgi:hypothetical protein